MSCHSEKGHGYGFGVDFEVWHWCEFAKMLRRAENLAADEKHWEGFERHFIDRTTPKADPARGDARAALIARQKGDTEPVKP